MSTHQLSRGRRSLWLVAVMAGTFTVPAVVHADPPNGTPTTATPTPAVTPAAVTSTTTVTTATTDGRGLAAMAAARKPTKQSVTITTSPPSEPKNEPADTPADTTPTAPAAVVTEAPSLFDVCPLAGPSTFEDSWGWARSGGRRHEGVDMIADRGTPVIAVRDGYAQFKTNGLGGRAIWLTAPNGDKFYYAHLDGWEGESRDVRAGDLIGYVGSTGNAQGPHLHFETLPGGSVENPYPHTLGACVPTPAEIAAMTADVDDPEA